MEVKNHCGGSARYAGGVYASPRRFAMNCSEIARL
jgi:hypothetical protein